MNETANICFQAIGVIHTPFQACEGMPIQSVYAPDREGTVNLFDEFTDGLQDLDGFDRIWLVYPFHRAPPRKLRVVPFRDNREHGVLAMRSPCRPNAIGLSCVQLMGIEGNTLRVGGVDMLDGTPLLDIKPYVPECDSFPNAKAGWLDAQRVDRTHADDRFKSGETE